MSEHPARPAPATVRLRDLEDAHAWASFDGGGENSARLSRISGAIHLTSADDEDIGGDPLPPDIDDDDRYVNVPDQRELDLGRPLAERFAREFMPGRFGAVVDAFHHRGAWRVFKALVDRADLLPAWHRFEEQAVRAALREWAQSEGFRVED